MYAAVFYDMDPDAEPSDFARFVEAFSRHRGYLDAFAASGDVLMIGTFGDPATEGSMALFRSRAAAERFIADDPFVVEGLVHRVRVLDWDPIVFTER